MDSTLMKKLFIYCLVLLTGVKVSAQNSHEKLIIKAIEADDVPALKMLIDSSNINRPVFTKGNALIISIENESPKSALFLLSLKADPNTKFNSRYALMYAVQKSDISIVRNLIKYGAAVNAVDTNGNSALMMASTGPDLRMVKILIRHGASLNTRNKKGYNARDFAVRSNNKAIAVYLKHVFEKNLPNYFDGPYISFVNRRKIKATYLCHDSLRHRTISYKNYYDLKEIGNVMKGFAGDTLSYSISSNFSRPSSEVSNIRKLLIIGDIHGQFDTLKRFLISNKIVDKNLKWNFGDGTVIFIGDIFDRGEKVTEALWFIYKLEREAEEHGGNLQLLLGNHEMMVLHDDIRYISEKYFYLFNNLKINYSKYYSNKTVLGRWIRSKNTMVKIDSFLFVHGGMHPNILNFELTVDSVNILVNKYLNYRNKANLLKNNSLKFLLSYNGPFWYRGLVEEADGCKIPEEDLEKMLKYYNVKHIVVGHTFKPEIKSLNNGKVISTDVPFYLPDGYPMQALLLEGDKLLILNSKGERREFILSNQP